MASADTTARIVCVNCKLRKKKCDKAQPRCGYCNRRKLSCQYKVPDPDQRLPVRPELSLSAAPNAVVRSSLLLSTSLSEVLCSKPITGDSTLYLQVLRIIRKAGQYVDDTSARYFRGVHWFIPVISRRRIHDYLVNFGAPPPVDFSILLLGLFLATYHPELASSAPEPLDQETIYFATKALFAQVQASVPPSLNLIQAGITIATYEYANGKVHDAFASIGACARLGYAAGLHLANPVQDMNIEAYQKAEEEANTWWGIIIFERLLFCEIFKDYPQPLLTKVPQSDDFRLPTETDSDFCNIDAISISPHNITERDLDARSTINGFAYIAQAAWYMDQVFQALDMTDINLKYTRLKGLDHALRTYLGIIMDHSEGKYPMFCTANSIIMRSLFILHLYVVDHKPEISQLKDQSPNDWVEKSNAALETACNIVKALAASQNNVTLAFMDTIPPSARFVTREALRHACHSKIKSDEGGEREKQLRMSLQRFENRWGFVSLE